MELQDRPEKQKENCLKSELYRLIQTDETIYNFILESSFDGLWYQDLTTGNAFFSRRWKEILGYEEHELKDQAHIFSDLIYEPDIEAVNKNTEQYLSGKTQKYEMEFRMKHKNGSILWILAKGTTLKDKSGRACRLVGTLSDVTERNFANIRIKQSEYKLKATLNSTPEGNILISPDYKILLFNRQSQKNALKAFGRPLLEMANYVDYLPESDLESFLQNSRKVFSGEQVQYDTNMAGHWFHISCYPVYYDDGKLLGMSINSSLIDRRKKAEEELQASNQRLQLIMEATNDGFWDWNVKTGETYYNPAFYTMLGYREDTFPKEIRFIAQLLHPDEKDQVLNLVNQCVEGKISHFEQEFRMKAKRGDWIWVLARGKCVQRDQNGKADRIVGTHTNITERRLMQMAIEKRIVSLTRPLDYSESITFDELFDLAEIQQIQDEFSAATGVASIITLPNGTPITAPSNFTHLCNDIIRKTPKGCSNCFKSDAALGRYNPEGPVIQLCESGGLWDAGASITIGQRHIANWLIGQVRNETQTEEAMRKYAREIGVEEQQFMTAFYNVPVMSRERFEKTAQLLFSMAKQLSSSAYQNILQARMIVREKEHKAALQKSEENLRTTLRSIGDGVISTDTNGCVVDMNPIAEKLCGWKLIDALDKPLSEVFKIINAQTRHTVADPVKKVLENGEIVGLANHTVLISKDGSEYQIADSAAPIKNNEGTITGVVLVFSDVTENYIAQKQIKDSAERFQLAMNASNDGLWDWDLHLIIYTTRLVGKK